MAQQIVVAMSPALLFAAICLGGYLIYVSGRAMHAWLFRNEIAQRAQMRKYRANGILATKQAVREAEEARQRELARQQEYIRDPAHWLDLPH